MGSLNRNIAKIALPAIVSNLTVPLLGLCDTAVTGHLGHPRFVAAIAVGSMMLNVLLWSFGFLRMGTTGLTAQAFGASDSRACRLMFTRSLLLALSLGFILIILQRPLGELLLRLIGADSYVSALALEYFRICVWGVPGLLGSMAISGWFLGMQDSTRPMAIAIATNIINILASILLVFPLGMGFRGTACGTLIANWSALLLGLLLVRHFCKGSLPLMPLREAVDFRGMRRFFKVNADIFCRSFFIMAVSLGVTSIGARMGELTLAANTIVMQMFFLFSYFMDGLAFSAEALSGKCVGARDRIGLRRTVRRLLVWSFGVAAVFTVCYLFGYGAFARLLVPEAPVLERVAEMRIWIWLLPFASVLAFIFDGFFIGLTFTRQMLVVTAAASLAFFAINFLMPSESATDASRLWIAFEVYLFIRGAALAALYPCSVRRLWMRKGGVGAEVNIS